jgi:hypothetical protein
MDAAGDVQDFVLGLPELHGQHSGNNIGAVVATTLTNFGVDKASVGYFVLDNAYNNDTAVHHLAGIYGLTPLSGVYAAAAIYSTLELNLSYGAKTATHTRTLVAALKTRRLS